MTRLKVEWGYDIHSFVGTIAALIFTVVMWESPLWAYTLVVLPSGFIVANTSRWIWTRKD